MPFFDGSAGRVYYRHWTCGWPLAQIVFLHGYGEHSGVYHRFGDFMASRKLDVWALDAIGHGLSEGVRGQPASIEHLRMNAACLTGIAQDVQPGLPTVLIGHSMGAISASAVIAVDQTPFVGVILGGMPIEALDDSQRRQFLQGVMSQDLFYLDELENDPLKVDLSFAVERIPALFSPQLLDALQAALPKINLPLLLLSGEKDFLYPPAMVQRWAACIPGARAQVFPNNLSRLHQ
jgi:alpha-beta hydrolase superfamily lysophospholipase